MHADEQYKQLVSMVLSYGQKRPQRATLADGTKLQAISMFGTRTEYDLTVGFPLLTTKKVPFKLVASELIWFLRGDTNIKFLHEHGNHIWDDWRQPNGDLGPIYGKQWRDFGGVDQIVELQNGLIRDPNGRRHILSAWNVGEISKMALPPCHCFAQFYVDGVHLDCQLYQRSADLFLGVPFNIASYALLTELLANSVGLKAGKLIHVIGDAHIYENHMDQLNEQLTREPFNSPEVIIKTEGKRVEQIEMSDIELVGYHHHPALKGEVAI